MALTVRFSCLPVSDAANQAVGNEFSQAWEAEIKARWAEIERGDIELISATEVFADVHRKLQ